MTGRVQLVRSLDQMSPTRRQWRRWTRFEADLATSIFEDVRRELLDEAVPPDRKDDLLAALLRSAQRDGEAAITVVICLLPGLCRAIRRFAPSLDPEEAWAELIVALCEKVRLYPLDRRPRRIAANLLWDATRQLLRAVRANQRWTAHVAELDTAHGADGEPALSLDGLWDLAVDAGVLSQLDVALINATRVGGMRLNAAAHLLGVNYEAAKKRRQRAEAAWTRWWAPERRAAA